MCSDNRPLLDLFLVLIGPYLLSDPKTFNLGSYTRFVLGLTMTILTSILNTTVLSLYTLFLFAVLVISYSLLHHLDNILGCSNYILQRIEKRIQAQLTALRNEERKTADRIDACLAAIREWDASSAELMKKIRAMETKIANKTRNWEPVPQRAKRRLEGGLTIWEPPSPPPSPWAVVRWWKGQDRSDVYEAACALDWISARLQTVANAYHGFVEEHEKLADALRRTDEKWADVWRLPDRSRSAWCERMNRELDERERVRMMEARRRPVQQQYVSTSVVLPFSDRLGTAIRENGEMIHVCLACGDQHNWMHQYPTIAAAAATSFFSPCPAAQERLIASGMFSVSPRPAPVLDPSALTNGLPLFGAQSGLLLAQPAGTNLVASPALQPVFEREILLPAASVAPVGVAVPFPAAMPLEGGLVSPTFGELDRELRREEAETKKKGGKGGKGKGKKPLGEQEELEKEMAEARARMRQRY